MKLKLHPIHIYCFHQISDVFDPESMWKCDWISTNDFKSKIYHLQKEYTFISLQEAYEKLQHDTVRLKKYAVLTADDGWLSMMNIIPWLAEQKIPITLFINPLYLDGIHKQERETENLLTKKDLCEILQKYSNVSIASHGWSHKDTTKQDSKEFEDDVYKAEEVLSQISNKIPFFAFTYGRYRREYIGMLHKHHLVPVLIDGNANIKYKGAIHRENIDEVV